MMNSTQQNEVNGGTPLAETTGSVLVCLGDLFADTCVVCGERAYYGLASVSGCEGCREAIRRGQTYCKTHIPNTGREAR